MPTTLLDHLLDVRRKLLISTLAVVVGSVVAHVYHEAITVFLLKPIGGEALYFLSPLEPLLFIFKIDLFAGTVLALPVIHWSILSFVRPALSRSSWFSLLLAYGVSLACAFGSITYAYLISIPAGLHFLTSLSVPGIETMLTATSYLRFLLASIVLLALISQIPVILLAGIRYRVFDASTLSSRRGHIYLVAVILLSVLTPTTDPLNLVLILLPASLLFEGSLLAGRMMVRPA